MTTTQSEDVRLLVALTNLLLNQLADYEGSGQTPRPPYAR